MPKSFQTWILYALGSIVQQWVFSCLIAPFRARKIIKLLIWLAAGIFFQILFSHHLVCYVKRMPMAAGYLIWIIGILLELITKFVDSYYFFFGMLFLFMFMSMFMFFLFLSCSWRSGSCSTLFLYSCSSFWAICQ